MFFHGEKNIAIANQSKMMMFRRFHLPFTLIVSALLHLSLFAMVSIVVAPSSKATSRPTVSFLGSILNKESINDGVLVFAKKNKVPDGKISRSLEGEPVYRKRAALLKIRRISFDREFQINRVGKNRHRVDVTRRYIDKTSNEIKPEIIFNKPGQQIEYPGRKVTFVRLRAKKQAKSVTNIFWNPPHQRDILYEPPLSESRFWSDKAEGDFRLEFEFLVSSQGNIIAVKKLTSSGFSEIDAQAVRYLKKWQFAPSSQEQWGKIKLNFNFKDTN